MKHHFKIAMILSVALLAAASCQKEADDTDNGGLTPPDGGFQEAVPQRPDYVNANLIYYGNGGDEEAPDEWILNLYTDMDVVDGYPVGAGQYLCINFYSPVNQAQEPSLNYLKGEYSMPSAMGLSEYTYIQGEIFNYDTPLGSITMPVGTFFGDIPEGQTEFEADLIREGSFSIADNGDGTFTVDGVLVGRQYVKRYFSYTGDFDPVDRSDSGSSGQEIPNTNLTEDVDLSGLTEARLIDMGDFFATGEQNYRMFLLYLAEQGVDISKNYPTGSGRLLHLELFVPWEADPADGIPAGEYVMANRIADGSYMPKENIEPFRVVEGRANVFSDNTGTWYQELKEDEWLNYGRITGGTVTVERDGDAHKITIALTDCGDPAHKVSGVWTTEGPIAL